MQSKANKATYTFIWHHFMGFILSLHTFYMFLQWEPASLWIHIFSPSLLMTSCLGNIQWRWAPTALVSCCNSHFLNASCFMHHRSFNPHYTSFESSLLFTLNLRIESSIWSALARRLSFAGAPFFIFRFQISFRFSPLFFLSLSKESWRQDSIPHSPS